MEDDTRKDMQTDEPPAEGAPQPQPAATPEEVSAEVVTIKGSAKLVHAQTVNVDGGQVRMLRGETVNVDLKNGGIGAMFSGTADIDVTNGGVGFVRASEATVKAQSVGFVIASNARVEGRVGFVFDVKAGLVAGIACGLVLSALKLVFGPRRVSR